MTRAWRTADLMRDALRSFCLTRTPTPDSAIRRPTRRGPQGSRPGVFLFPRAPTPRLGAPPPPPRRSAADRPRHDRHAGRNRLLHDPHAAVADDRRGAFQHRAMRDEALDPHVV